MGSVLGSDSEIEAQFLSSLVVAGYPGLYAPSVVIAK
jgi:hypothetical protein